MLVVQATTDSTHAARRTKLDGEGFTALWDSAEAQLEVWSWAKQEPLGSQKVWTVRREVWKPVFFPETDSLMENLQDEVSTFLSTFEGDKICSQQLKKNLKLDAIAPTTWTRVLQKVDHGSKKEPVRGGLCLWRL